MKHDDGVTVARVIGVVLSGVEGFAHAVLVVGVRVRVRVRVRVKVRVRVRVGVRVRAVLTVSG